jgi:hypothetical protein
LSGERLAGTGEPLEMPDGLLAGAGEPLKRIGEFLAGTGGLFAGAGELLEMPGKRSAGASTRSAGSGGPLRLPLGFLPGGESVLGVVVNLPPQHRGRQSLQVNYALNEARVRHDITARAAEVDRAPVGLHLANQSIEAAFSEESHYRSRSLISPESSVITEAS